MDSSTPYRQPGDHPPPRILSERAFDERRKTADESRGSISTGRWMWEWFKAISTAVLLFLTIRTFVVEAFKIPTGSMERTLLVGDFLLVNKAVYGAEVPGTHTRFPAFAEPGRGDVVVFLPPHDPTKNYVKRLVGMPGDTLAMHDKVLFVNGEPQPEPYVRHIDPITDPGDPQMMWQLSYLVGDRQARRSYRPTRDNWGPIVVPEGKFFTLGDNRDNSEDSRYWGFIDKVSIKGRPILVYYSFEHDLANPIPWVTGVRWARIGSLIH
ncbi:MAG TPA: signal peptidase I [Longimicrobiaceae bacterium]|nr:signal peptidase I [Longimicrobiaceae bacterium]